jgi:hypothetical protein
VRINIETLRECIHNNVLLDIFKDDWKKFYHKNKRKTLPLHVAVFAGGQTKDLRMGRMGNAFDFQVTYLT